MAKVYHGDTIAAIATPIGEGAIAVIRVSGPDAIALVEKVFKGRGRIADAAGYTVHHGKLVAQDGGEVDDVLATVFRNPNSYTGEDSVEISCHGGMFVTQKALETILATGVRQAEPGEFTKRAFLNGKMDLAQAEAVADIIAARTEASRQASLNQLEGRFSVEIRALRAEMLDLGSLIELELDFSDEGLALISKRELLGRIDSLTVRLRAMIDSYRLGKLSRDGVSVAIIGKPNAGKSSLFNALLKERRAIVTDIPGTTRDTLEESITIGGILFRLTDTAGVRHTTDPVETEGVARARDAASQSDITILVADASSGPSREEALSILSAVEMPSSVVVAYNKIDLCKNNGFLTETYTAKGARIFEVLTSAKTGIGLDELRQCLQCAISNTAIEACPIQVTSARHVSSLAQANSSLERARRAVQTGSSGEFVAVDIRAASVCLAEIIGEITTDETLDNIFSHFCIGK